MSGEAGYLIVAGAALTALAFTLLTLVSAAVYGSLEARLLQARQEVAALVAGVSSEPSLPEEEDPLLEDGGPSFVGETA